MASQVISREQLTHIVVDRLTSPAFIMGRNGTIAFWNQAAEQAFGFRATEAEGRPLDALVGGETACYAAISEATKRGSASFATEFRTKMGHGLPLAVTVDAVSDHGTTDPEYFLLTARASAPRAGARQELDSLTQRQREVLELIAEGWSTRHIAQKLKLSVKTVETHRAHLMQRLKVDSVAKLVRYAVAVGLVPPTP